MRTIFLLTSCFFIFYASMAWSEPACMKNVKTEEEINVCQHSEAKRLELQVKELEEKIRASFKEIQLERFNNAQLAWQQMTEKDCEVAADFFEGSPVYPAVQAQCLQIHYQERIKIIRNYLCPEYNYVNGCVN